MGQVFCSFNLEDWPVRAKATAAWGFKAVKLTEATLKQHISIFHNKLSHFSTNRAALSVSTCERFLE